MKDDKKAAKAAPTYAKQQFLESKQFSGQQKDVLNALLQDTEEYTHEQVNNIVDEFHRRVVE